MNEKKTVFRPFWSYDVAATEDWISHMARRGWMLSCVHFPLRRFSFHQGTPCEKEFFITYQKGQGDFLSQSLKQAGYEKIAGNKDYQVLVHGGEPSEIRPDYSGFYEKNRTLKFWSGLLALLVFFLLWMPNMLMTGLRFGSSYGFTAAWLVQTALLLWLAGTFFALWFFNHSLERRLSGTPGPGVAGGEDMGITRERERELRRQKKRAVRLKLAWMYAPDKMEQWLEKMEASGFQLYRVGTLGSLFYFIKGAPRKMKYAADYQSKTMPQYFEMNRAAGWQTVFTSVFQTQAIILWRHAYTDEIPEFYSDYETKRNAAKQFVKTYGVMLLAVGALYALMAGVRLSGFAEAVELSPSELAGTIIFTVVCVEFLFLGIRAVRYYFRVKKSR